jgi:uroporphyrinogen decarboxylase
MDEREIVISQIKHIETERVPYTLGFQRESRERLDDFYGFVDWRSMIRNYIDPIWVMDCQQKVALKENITRDIYGTVWREDGGAAHIEEPALKEPEISNLKLPDAKTFFTNGEMQIARSRLESSNRFTVVHIPWGIFEKSWSLRGFENALMDLAESRLFYVKLVERITEHISGFVDLALELPVDGIMFGDDWGGQTGLLMGAKRWREIFKPLYRELYTKVKKSGRYVLTHCCGNIVDILPDLIDIGLDVYESFQPEAMDIFKVKKDFGKYLTFWGGLGAQTTIPYGTPESISNTIEELIDKMSVGGGFILAPSKDPPAETPTENLTAMVEIFARL